MSLKSPIQSLHEQAEAAMLRFGAAETETGAPQGAADSGATSGRAVADVVDTYGEPEVEYASLRKGCVLLDQPQRATLRITGGERMAFLNRMLTQELKGFSAWSARRSFWLSRKGRIDADVRLIETPEATIVDCDVLCAPRLIETLSAYIITEDVAIENDTERAHRLALHGPSALALLGRVGAHEQGAPIAELRDGQACAVRIAGRRVLVDRQDSTGEIGLEMLLSAEDVRTVYEHLLEVGDDVEDTGRITGTFRLKPAGWAAYNTARVEAGWPMYQIDFGMNSLPAETGVLNDRVSFTKGCYLGQEIVARMQALGHPRQVLCGLRVNPPGEGGRAGDAQPETGSRVFIESSGGGGGGGGGSGGGQPQVVGAVTSSVRSPMLGDVPIAFAMLAWAQRAPGGEVWVETRTGRFAATVIEGLAFWRTPR